MLARSVRLIPLLLASCAPVLSAPAESKPSASARPLDAYQAPRAAAPRAPTSSALDRAIVAALRAPDSTTASTPGAATAEHDEALIPPLVREPSDEPPTEPAEVSDPDARLPPESIQRVVRTSSGRFRGCYQRALMRNRQAGGEILTFFVIGSEGLVQLVQEESVTLRDREMRQCVQRAFFELHFPKPPAGRPITVLYPMRFGQGGSAPLDLPSARRAAEPPPPGFAERMRSGIPVPSDPVVIPFEDAAPTPPSPCASGDPICPDL
jgi:hypothetical protein